jgi:16S rRNA (cytosine967-C5)-methyltransferase
MFVESYFQVAAHLFEQYELQMPLHLFLKEYFRNNKKYGSRDRKFIAELLYGIYRSGQGNNHLSIRDRMLMGSFLANRLPILFFEKSNKKLAEKYSITLNEKIKYLCETYHFNIEVPFQLSEQILKEEFIANLFSQPKVFIRVRKNKKGIEHVLNQNKIEYQLISNECVAVSNAVKLNEILVDEDYVIQDWASQQVGNYFEPNSKENWWDVCCASGGKSILLLDKNRQIDLTVTDIRPSIIKNLHQRFQTYGYISQYVSHLLDASQDVSAIIRKKMDGIICDVPCSGSGTWARSPEQFYFFTEEKLKTFCETQTEILKNSIVHLKPNGKFYYITCSVFAEENEFVLNKLKKEIDFQIQSQTIINAWHVNGDSMYIASITRN